MSTAYLVAGVRTPFGRYGGALAPVRPDDLAAHAVGWRFVNPVMRERYGTHAMPETAEIVAERHGIARADQDLFALRSQERTAKAIAGGRLAREIEPVPVPQRKGDPVPVGVDEHPRATSLEALGRLRPLFPDGTVTAGNGGAIALGHPLGASGARLALTAALELHDRGARRALATMCIGVGQGIAVLFEAA